MTTLPESEKSHCPWKAKGIVALLNHISAFLTMGCKEATMLINRNIQVLRDRELGFRAGKEPVNFLGISQSPAACELCKCLEIEYVFLVAVE